MHRVAAAVEQAVENAAAIPAGIIGRMIRLQPNRQPPGKPIVLRNRVTTRHFAGDQNQILIPA